MSDLQGDAKARKRWRGMRGKRGTHSAKAMRGTAPPLLLAHLRRRRQTAPRAAAAKAGSTPGDGITAIQPRSRPDWPKPSPAMAIPSGEIALG